MPEAEVSEALLHDNDFGAGCMRSFLDGVVALAMLSSETCKLQEQQPWYPRGHNDTRVDSSQEQCVLFIPWQVMCTSCLDHRQNGGMATARKSFAGTQHAAFAWQKPSYFKKIHKATETISGS